MNAYRELLALLSPKYGESEARAVAFLVLEEAFGISRTEVYADKIRDFSEKEHNQFEKISQELACGVPVQYVLGATWFDGLRLQVTSDTLIPRPETEELVTLVADYVHAHHKNGKVSFLDVGTGSGCIAVALKHRFPSAHVTAWDVSEAALRVARKNAAQYGCAVSFRQVDLLNDACPSLAPPPLIIVSNPPYICFSEATEMEQHVVDFEPEQALFVPNHDPLLFYRPLARLAKEHQAEALFVEVNRAYAHGVAHVMRETSGYTNVAVLRDSFGNERFVVGL